MSDQPEDRTPQRLTHVREDGTAPSGTFLMESAAQGIWSRWSFIGAGSRATLISRDGQAHWVGDVPVGLPPSGRKRPKKR